MKNQKRWLGVVVILILGLASQTSRAQSARKTTKADLDRRAGGKGRKQPGSVLSVQGQTAVAQFRDRLEFHQLPVGTTFDAGTGQLKKESGLIKPAQLEPAKILWFDYPFDAQAAGDHLLVCTNITRNKNGSGGVGDFCGIISASGDVVFKFPVSQRSPKQLLRVLGINGDGTYAEVFIGRLVPGEDGADISEPREILAWRAPNKFTRFPGPWKDGKPKDPAQAFDNLLQGFKEREKQH